MQRVDTRAGRLITSIAGLVAIIVGIAMPVGYFTLAYQHQSGALDAEAEINGHIVTEVIHANPEMWQFHEYELLELLTRRPRHGYPEIRRIRDTDGRVVAENVDPLRNPLITRFAELRDAGTVAGSVEISRSLLPLMMNTGFVTMFGLLAGLAVFGTLRVLPLRALDVALAENNRLLEDSEGRLRRTEALRDIDHAVSSTLELQSLLNLLLEKLDFFFPRSLLIIRLLNGANDALELAAWRNASKDELRDAVRLSSSGLACAVFKGRCLLTIDDLQTDPRSLNPELFQRYDVQSYLGMPLMVQDRALGTLSILTKESRAFNPEEIEFVSMLAGHAAVAIHNAQLHTEAVKLASDLARTNQELKRNDEIQRLLKELNQDITRLDAESLLQKITDKARTVLLVDQADARLFGTRDTTEIDPETIKRVPFSASRGRSTWIRESRKPLMIPDITQETGPLGGGLKNQEHSRLHGYLAVPIFSESGEVLGILRVLSNQPRVFTQSETDLLLQLAHGAAVALRNARLLEEVKQRAEELTALNTVAIEAGRTLDVREILDIALDKALALTNRERGYIRLKDPVTGELSLAAHRGIPQDYIDTSLHDRIPGGKSDQVFESGESLIVNDPTETHLRKASRFGVHATAWIPMKARGKVVGIMNVSTTGSDPFTPREVNLLEAIASMTGNAWENARLFQEAEARAKEISALYDVSTTVNQSLDLDMVLQEVLQKIMDIFHFDATRVYLFRPETGELHLRAALDTRSESLAHMRVFRPGQGNIGKSFQTGNPVIFSDVRQDPGYKANSLSRVMQSSGFNFFAAFPVRTKLESVGVLSCIGRFPRSLTSAEIRLLTSMTDQIGLTVGHVRLYEETKKQAGELEKTNTELRRREDVQSLLKELSLDITTLDVEQLLKKLTGKVREILKVDTSDVKLMEGGTQRLVGVSGINAERLRSSTIVRAEGPSRWIEENRKPLVIPDITQSHEVQIGETTRGIGIRGYLRVPLFSRHGEVLGSIRALTYQPRNFSQEEVDLLQQIANGAALALENARLLDEIKHQAMELRRSNKVKDEFLGVMSHELRTPLSTVMGYAAILQDGGLGKIQSKQAKALQVIENQTKDLLDMINSILEATKIEAGAAVVQNQETNLKALLDDIRSTYDFSLKKKVSFIWDYDGDLPQIATDPGKLKHVLQNLMNNAIKFTHEGHVALSARYVPRWQKVELRVSDTGVGIPPEMQSAVFERFQQVDSSDTRLYGGVGLGLYIAKSFTEMLGGTLALASEVGKGSVFTLALPAGLLPGEEYLRTEVQA